MIGIFDGSPIVEDYKIDSRRAGCPGVCPDTEQGGSNDIFDVSGSESEGVTFLKWSRELETGDSEDIDIVEGSASPIVFAMSASNSDTIAYHRNNKGAAEINF